MPALRRLSIAVVCAVALAPAELGVVPAAAAGAVYPGASWAWTRRPPSAEARALEAALTATLRAGDTTALLVVVGGRVGYGYGDAALVSYLASARKSVVAML